MDFGHQFVGFGLPELTEAHEVFENGAGLTQAAGQGHPGFLVAAH